ncbi:hypothetical protein M422DRAFT_177249 [Sphaerobolus stellatus SS14]|uniref:GH3 auxin-responsive promoter n=1 Tax=Sphaerobolus stellatus (strain SS14) TaxID=990650 RepID=A0A0C9VJY0_SPHS4|nr:hypothetical protein M422DRAFT_177249 [Sphaerobolus stellatus SS14]
MSQIAPPESISLLTPELSQGLKQHYNNVLLEIIQRNRVSRYVSESLPLRAFRNSLDEPPGIDHSADEVTAERFRETVPLSEYDTYEPFIRKLFEQPCKQAEVENLLSAGYPSYVSLSSFTTGKSLKYFPKYAFPRPSPQEGSVSAKSMFNCLVMHLGTKRAFDVEDETGELVAKFPLCTFSAGLTRTMFNMKVDQDQIVMGMKVPPLTSPLAVSFIDNYRSFLLMHALFALGERRLETLFTTFSTILVDLITFVEEEWAKLLTSIETGILPDFQGTEHVLSYLQPYFVANPERAAELRSVESMKGSPGWLIKIWPNLKEYTGIMSGAYGGVLPKVQSYFGPDVILRSSGYILSECWPGITYSGINLYRLAREDYYEFLPASRVEISEEETAACLVPVWQVETGRMYEPVVTTRDGLWRYRLGDLVRIEGFEQTNGFPIMSFIERRHAEVRVADAMVPAMVIVNAILSTTEDTVGRVMEFTSYFDSRSRLPTIGYVIELDGDIGKCPNPSLARHQVLEVLKAQHENIQTNVDKNRMSLPTIRIVQRGTFADYRRWRVESAGISLTQVKVPVVLKDETLVEWLSKRAFYEA